MHYCMGNVRRMLDYGGQSVMFSYLCQGNYIFRKFGIDLGSIFRKFGIDLGSIFIKFGIDLGSTFRK